MVITVAGDKKEVKDAIQRARLFAGFKDVL